ncbi:ScbA/BarX family gamma-butyrolactone biosynthesis protein [Nocardia huaxiensis]|uniref:ScbA/BarX family gamma-butyrolactone biosynthesis protein n=1 Tax=Nocardia huaxiensis TaxID=2755382 RepID=UPI001FD1F622|nr:ScbA/BarX family gamma-butyrolactone biosynthesis protein [Nocardia huaxiensis]
MIPAETVAATHVRTIPRTLAHRHSVAEVFVTSLDAVGEDAFVIGAQLPRMHGHYGDHAGALATRHDPIAVMEAARQASIALTHEFYGVPADRAFLVRTFNSTGADTSAWEIDSAPADLVMHARALRKHYREETLQGLDLILEISCAGVPLSTVDGSFSWVSPRAWSAMRSGFRKQLGLGEFEAAIRPADRAEAATVGRENWRNVVIGEPRSADGVTRAALVADTSHPILFDHELDHVPGNLLIEAARQTAVSMMRPQLPVLSVTSAFGHFVELDAPAECVARIADEGVGPTVVHCEIHQHGAVAARIDLEFADDAPGSESEVVD